MDGSAACAPLEAGGAGSHSGGREALRSFRHIRRPCEILMESGRAVMGDRLRSLQSVGGF